MNADNSKTAMIAGALLGVALAYLTGCASPIPDARGDLAWPEACCIESCFIPAMLFGDAP